jgi:hypothetical protein
MRLGQGAFWAFGAGTLALAPACGGVAVATEDAAADAGTTETASADGAPAEDARMADAEAVDGGSDGGAADAARDAVHERDARRCDVFVGVDYGAPCINGEPCCE